MRTPAPVSSTHLAVYKRQALVRVAHWMTNVEHDTTSPIWRPWLLGFGRRLQTIRYDERGCGLSGSDDVELGLEAALEELEAVIDATGLQRVALLGQSGASAPAIACLLYTSRCV